MSSKFSRNPLLLLVPLLLLIAPPAHAATQACKEGVKATIEGKIRGFSNAGDRMWFYVEDASWDCLNFYVALPMAQARSCAMGGQMRATGTLTLKDKENVTGFWNLTDRGPGNKGPRLTRSFSCGAGPAENARTKSGNK